MVQMAQEVGEARVMAVRAMAAGIRGRVRAMAVGIRAGSMAHITEALMANYRKKRQMTAIIQAI